MRGVEAGGHGREPLEVEVHAVELPACGQAVEDGANVPPGRLESGAELEEMARIEGRPALLVHHQQI
jgi:hypothetical protein